MQVFKLYFKILNKYKGQMIMYLGIFVALLSIFILNNKSGDNGYVNQKCKFAVSDSDQSQESKALLAYLSQKHDKVTIADEELETIQDALYNRNMNCLLKIPKGFGEKMQQGEVENALEVYTIPGTQKANIFEGDVDSYVNYLTTYYSVGEEQAIEKTNTTLQKKADVRMNDGKNTTGYSNQYYFFKYLGWIVMVMIIVGVTPILCTVFSQKELRKRTACSPYPYSRMNVELFAAIAVTGIGICAVLFCMGMVLIGDDMFTLKGAWHMLNTFCYLLIALAIAYLISKFTTNEQVISMISNVVSLGMAFLCGIFVPSEFLGDAVIKVSKLLPAYWFSQGVNAIENLDTTSIQTLGSYLGVELLFAAALWCVAMVVARNKRA